MDKKQYVLTLLVAVIAGLVGGVVSSQLFVGVPAFAQKTPQQAKVIQAEKFELVDRGGKIRGALGVTPEDKVVLILFDKSEKGGILLSVVNGSPSLIVYDKERKARAILSFGSDEEPQLALYDRKGALGALMAPSSLGIYSDGNARAVLGSTELEATRTGEGIKRPVSSLVLFDKDEKVLWQAP